jgi:predicted nucleic acid-binding protein
LIIYAESSAVLAWLLGEPAGEDVRRLLAEAKRVVSSTLTQVECARALARSVVSGRLGRGDELAALRLMDEAATAWTTLEMSGRVLARARTPFPLEPVRTLDAFHLATAVAFREEIPDLVVVSLDERVRGNAEALGIEIAP